MSWRLLGFWPHSHCLNIASYQVRAKIAEGLLFVQPCKNLFTEFAQIGNARWPQDAPFHLISIDCGEPRTAVREIAMQEPSPTQYIKVMTVRAHGLIAVRFNVNIPEIEGKEIYVAPYTIDASGRERRMQPRDFLKGGVKITRWACGVPQENPLLRIPFQYLPSECHQYLKHYP